MKRRVLVTGLVLFGATFASSAAAQTTPPDLRSIPPAVLMLVDTSGSMERLPGCVCTTAGCDECLPVCTSSGTSTRNRWSMTLEALTGSWTTFQCNSQDRRQPAFNGQYDDDYYIPFHDPTPSGGQNGDGILDVYRTRAHFGLMTFDGIGTLVGGDPLIASTVFGVDPFQTTQRGPTGMWSYGNNMPFSFPGCATTYMINNGARGVGATEGGLVSVGPDTSATDFNAINQLIQDRLIATRPFGGTPIAGMLDDARYYFTTNNDVSATGDPYHACRPRYVVMVTDGYPDSDFRDSRFNCATAGYTCPYEPAEDISGDLCQWDAGQARCTGNVNGVYVVGFDIADPQAIARLNDIANLGGTSAALFANDRLGLLSSLSTILDSAAQDVTTRTAPSFASSAGVSAGIQTQFQFQSGFLSGNTGAAAIAGVARIPWTGTLERVRIECDALVPTQRDVDDSDRFHVILNNRNLGSNPRLLYTAVPPSAATAANTIIGESAGVSLQDFSQSNTAVTQAILSVGTSAARDAVFDFVHGVAPAERATRRLGDIYHSSPVTIGPPKNDLADESYNQYRLLPEVANRPVVVYVGTNDGVLHAFAAEDHNILAGPHTGTNITGGDELWGFVPPAVLPALKDAAASHQFLVDGTPVVREVLFSRVPGTAPDPARYHTVLVTGLRGGGKAFEALDVTDPLEPKLLWQFGAPGLGLTYGRPAIGVAYFIFNGALQERAIAVLPGGAGVIDTAAGPTCVALPSSVPTTATTRTLGTRTRRRCWTGTEGRQLYVVDLETGTLLKHFDQTIIGSPMTGAASLYTGDTGTTATRGFMTDADGVIWRLDLSARDASNWDLEPFHDIFWDDGVGNLGQPAYEPPLLSVDQQGRVVVIQATGDGDRLDSLAVNRVVSLTENVSFSSAGAFTGFSTYLNWDIGLQAGEQVTGPLELFDSKVYFGTFQATPSATNACAYGESFLWGIHYTRDDGGGTPGPIGLLEFPSGSGTFVDHTPTGTFSNALIMGVSVTQRPACYDGVSTTDPYFGGSRYQVTNHGGGQFELVAQVSGTAARAAGAAVGTFTQTLPMPGATTRIQSFGGTVE